MSGKRRKREPHSVDPAEIRENALKHFKEDNCDIISTFAITLNEEMEKQKIDQAEMAKALKIATGALSNYRNGRTEPGFTKIIQMAKYLNVDCMYLMTGVAAKNTTLNSDIGLSNKAIELLKFINRSDLKEDKRTLSFLNMALSDTEIRKEHGAVTTIFSLLDQYVKADSVFRADHVNLPLPTSLEEYEMQLARIKIEKHFVPIESSEDMWEEFPVSELYAQIKMNQIREWIEDYRKQEKEKNNAKEK